ncbi:hypothetical protein Psta_3739 [Pirellula staleyi DSM 6068]|uniref:Carboxypeptidase regulatory-like domain-containing protein n=1 Tax=Pirellula staleyi (strain ATCC 27377 / DSM 6068 / ICPB 4128) TaxID=530564 RepID=D2R029_PIRSD|nr:hypothetical protein Psta_3739 [Pirellula staleyi DSM 6068]
MFIYCYAGGCDVLRKLMGLTLVCLASFAAGCSSGSSEVKVEGTVMFMNTPVESGEIIFMPEDGKSPNVATRIEQGKYSLVASPGLNRVSITAYREIPGKFDNSNPGQPTPMTEMYIPPQFNSNTTLKVTVDAAQPTLDFPLGSS